MADYSKFYSPDALILPDKIVQEKMMRAATKFQAPKELILDGYCTPVENQGDLPYCAAYAATSFAESILWRKKHYHEDIDPEMVYKKAKEIDGHPELKGTSIDAALQALLELDIFDKNICKVKTFAGRPFGRTDGLKSVQFAIHEYGCCVAGFNISKEWSSPSFFTDTISSKKSPTVCGHAVLITGYKKDRVRILNSWGKKYGDKGFVWVTNDVFDVQFIYGGVIENAY